MVYPSPLDIFTGKNGLLFYNVFSSLSTAIGSEAVINSEKAGVRLDLENINYFFKVQYAVFLFLQTSVLELE